MRVPRPRVLALLAAVWVAGCLDVDGELRPDGALALRCTYTPPRHATVKSETARLSSPHVRVEKLERDQSLPDYPPQEFTTAVLEVDDVANLPSAAAFSTVRVESDLAGGQLAVSLPGLDAESRERARASTDPGVERHAMRVRLRLPGRVVAAEPHAAVTGDQVTWTLSFRDLAGLGDSVRLVVRWTPRAGT